VLSYGRCVHIPGRHDGLREHGTHTWHRAGGAVEHGCDGCGCVTRVDIVAAHLYGAWTRVGGAAVHGM